MKERFVRTFKIRRRDVAALKLFALIVDQPRKMLFDRRVAQRRIGNPLIEAEERKDARKMAS